MVMHACNSSYLGGGHRRIVGLRPTQAKLARPYLKTKWPGHGSSGKAFAQHEWAPGFNPQYYKKKFSFKNVYM
jgi:hypothetical protein